MNALKKAWTVKPFRWGALIAGLTAAMVLLLPGLHLGGYSANQFLPHATCYLRDPGVIWLNVISDSFIALAYLSISATLGYIVFRARHDIPFHWMFAAFGLFIVACGFTHVMGVITVWRPYYWLAGDVKAVTAVASVATAVILPFTVPRVFSMIHDAKVSDERKLQLEIANEKLRESDELKSQFFANVSHELRTPLTLILGPLQRQLTAETLSDDERRELEVAERNAGLLLQQVNNLLDLASLEARVLKVQYARYDLARGARLVGSYFDGLAEERSIDYRVEVPEELEIEADVDKVQRSILNLLSNAFKFTPSGGAIQLTVEKEEADVLITVEDSGPGIPGPMREAIFERFRQIEGGATREAGGTGLGLAIVKEFVDLHGGSIEVSDSRLGGARFAVRLPLRAPAGAEISGIAEPESDAGRWAVDALRSQVATQATPTRSVTGAPDRPKVLVVEDNADMNEFIERSLSSSYEVTTAFNGQQGLEQARAVNPDLIITDVMMPVMSGDEMVRELQGDPDLREIPVIVLTAKADDAQRVDLLETGVHDHLTKPFRTEELLARVDGVVKRRRETIRRLKEVNESLEQRVEERTREVEEQAKQLRMLAADLSTAEQRERRRLARALHDHVQQLLVTAKLGVEQLRSVSTVAAEGHLTRLDEVLSETISATRGVTLELYPPILYDAGLAAALDWFGRRCKQAHHLDVHVEANPEAEPSDEDLQAFLFDAVRELLLNIVKHAQATSARVVLEREGSMARLVVEDDGVGCNPDDLLRVGREEGFGLFNIRERLSVLGGSLAVEKTPSGGCSVTILCPITSSREDS